MKLRLYTRDDIVVLEPVGKIMSREDVAKLDEKLYALLGKRRTKVILDLSKTNWLSSSAMSTLLNHNIKFREAGGSLILANLPGKIEQLIAITRLVSFFKVYDTLGTAIDSFEKKIESQVV
jgi:anti-sigma B factor antagonist